MKFVIVYSSVIVIWIILTAIGALGPRVNVVEHFAFKKCVVGSANNHISDDRLPMISMKTCQTNGVLIDDKDDSKLKSFPSHNVIFFVALPVKRSERVMSRFYQYLIVDIDISLKSDYVKRLKAHNHSQLEYHISIGYRNRDPEWNRLTSGNASRLLDCDQTKWGTHSCEHFPLFELWSCHHEHYLINLRLPSLPFADDNFRGISAIKDMTIVEIHQDPSFTKLWLIVKCVFFILSLFVLLVYWKQLSNDKFIWCLLCCLIFVNVPIELLSLLFDVPWMVIVNDFRHGLMMGALCLFWTVFISNAYSDGKEFNPLHREWRNFVLISISCVMLFVYEFCERGIQVFMPFYSIWGTRRGAVISYTMIIIATITMLLFVLGLLWKIITIIVTIRKDITQSATTDEAKEKLQELLGFVVLTASVCVFSVLGYVIPMEMYLLHWVHDNRHLSLYGALLLSNYGLWNVYVFSVTVLYSKIKSNMKLIDKTSH